MHRLTRPFLFCLAALAALSLAIRSPAQETKKPTKDSAVKKAGAEMPEMHKSRMFEGPKANKGFASHFTKDGKQMLTFSDDFVIPDTPAPHWQVVDSEGNVYLLNRLKIKEDKINKTITLPKYVHDVAKVQIWCAWAETLLGEAKFDQPVK
jgi:hypothetical protein